MNKEKQLYFLDNDYRAFLDENADADDASILAHVERLKRYVREGNPYRIITDTVIEAKEYFPEIKILFDRDDCVQE